MYTKLITKSFLSKIRKIIDLGPLTTIRKGKSNNLFQFVYLKKVVTAKNMELALMMGIGDLYFDYLNKKKSVLVLSA